MCNGPSLNQVDFDALAPMHLIGLNKIHLLFERVQLQLALHVAVNKLVIEQSAADFANLTCPSFLSYSAAADVIPDQGNIHYINTCNHIPPSFCVNPRISSFCEGATVTYVALQLAFTLGFERVFIVGMDHNFQCKGKPNEEQSMGDSDPNHFDPRYFAGSKWQLPDLEVSEASYRQADLAFRHHGRRIYDATEAGKCDVFERISFKEAVSLCKPASAATKNQ